MGVEDLADQTGGIGMIERVDPNGTQPTRGSKLPVGPGDLRGVLDQLELGKPLILNDGFVVADSGYMVTSQYVDIGVDKLVARPLL